MNKQCPFCGSTNIKLETKSSKNVTLSERYNGYKIRVTGSIRCNNWNRGLNW